MIFEFNGIKPCIDPSSFIHPQANITGHVIIGKNVYVGPGAAIRGDWGKIIIEDGANVQENCVIHMFPGTTVLIKKGAHLGHGCIIHGGEIGNNSLVGMNAVVMDDAIIGDECIVGALTLIKSEMIIPKRKVVVGNPGKIVKDVSDEMLAWKSEGTALYQKLPSECTQHLKETTANQKIVDYKIDYKSDYKTWKKNN